MEQAYVNDEESGKIVDGGFPALNRDQLIARLDPSQPSLYDALVGSCNSVEDLREVTHAVVARLGNNADFAHLQRLGEAATREKELPPIERDSMISTLQAFTSQFSNKNDVSSLSQEERSKKLAQIMDARWPRLDQSAENPQSAKEALVSIRGQIDAKAKEAEVVASRIDALRAKASELRGQKADMDGQKPSSQPKKKKDPEEEKEDSAAEERASLWKRALEAIKRFFGINAAQYYAAPAPQTHGEPKSQEEPKPEDDPRQEDDLKPKDAPKPEDDPNLSVEERLNAIEEEIRQLEERQKQLMLELEQLRTRLKEMDKVFLDNKQEGETLGVSTPEDSPRPSSVVGPNPGNVQNAGQIVDNRAKEADRRFRDARKGTTPEQEQAAAGNLPSTVQQQQEQAETANLPSESTPGQEAVAEDPVEEEGLKV
jgi:chromosome segregation ATPase